MHPIYTTRCFVLKSFERGEADRALALFTEDFGLIWALACGMRKHAAKLRGHMQDLSFATVSLVRGKRGWRVTNAASGDSLRIPHSDFERREFRARLASLLLRLLDTDERNDSLLATVVDSSFFVKESAGRQSLSLVELITVIRMLKSLGYMGDESITAPFTDSRGFSEETLELARRKRTDLTRLVNASLTASHL